MPSDLSKCSQTFINSFSNALVQSKKALFSKQISQLRGITLGGWKEWLNDEKDNSESRQRDKWKTIQDVSMASSRILCLEYYK